MVKNMNKKMFYIILFALVFMLGLFTLFGNLGKEKNNKLDEDEIIEDKYISKDYLIDENEISDEIKVNINNNSIKTFELEEMDKLGDNIKFGIYKYIINDNIKYLVDLRSDTKKANIYFENKLIASYECEKYGLTLISNYGEHYILSEQVEFYNNNYIIDGSGKIKYMFHGTFTYDEENNYLNIFEMDYENEVLKIYHFDLNKNDYKKLDFSLEYDYCSDEVSKKYNMIFYFE
jgi:hypothetical protein